MTTNIVHKTAPPNHAVTWFIPLSDFNGKEKDYESGFHYYGARYYWGELLTGWLSVDPMADKYPGISPYAYCDWNPIRMVDPDGKEPIKPLAGTVEGFVKFMDGLPTGIGTSTGAKSHAAMLRMGETKGFLPANTAPFNTSKGNRYIYTKKGGWIDMAHFMFYAGRAYSYKQQMQDAKKSISSIAFAFLSLDNQWVIIKQANMSPVGEAIQDGFYQEHGDLLMAPHSAFSYEDLPTDKFGAEFGADYFDPNSNKTFSEQIQDYLNNVLQATNPESAPNYDKLPNEYPEKPTQTNKTTTPLYTE